MTREEVRQLIADVQKRQYDSADRKTARNVLRRLESPAIPANSHRGRHRKGILT
jgi:hypothetical protein